MEQFTLSYKTSPRLQEGHPPQLCGVVASGNLEVLVEPLDSADLCLIEVNTSAPGFRLIWEAVLSDFVERNRVAGVRISINDAGATPAVVGLRLDQALDAYRSAV
ncbi:MAG: malonate decarboxylase acyl carrier protein [Desulfuromonadaceae bacterium]|nr:malonate decarboxylase acyl carrier protein [Desulfuromonadaceae bacterium]